MLAVVRHPYTVYDRTDASAIINFSTQFGVTTIREWHLFRSARVWAETVNTSTRIVYSCSFAHQKVTSEVIAKSFWACV